MLVGHIQPSATVVETRFVLDFPIWTLHDPETLDKIYLSTSGLSTTAFLHLRDVVR